MVVPADIQRQLAAKCLTLVGDQQPTRALVLDRSDQPLDHSDAAVLAHRAEALLNAAATAPSPESIVGELDALVGDEMAWLTDGQPQGSFQRGPDRCSQADKESKRKACQVSPRQYTAVATNHVRLNEETHYRRYYVRNRGSENSLIGRFKGISDPLEVRAVIPGTIVEIKVRKGQRISDGQVLLVLEAMKMYNEVEAKIDGKIDEISVSAGDRVEKGQLMIRIRSKRRT